VRKGVKLDDDRGEPVKPEALGEKRTGPGSRAAVTKKVTSESSKVVRLSHGREDGLYTYWLRNTWKGKRDGAEKR